MRYGGNQNRAEEHLQVIDRTASADSPGFGVRPESGSSLPFNQPRVTRLKTP